MPSIIQLANENISIAQACRWAGVEVPDGFGNRKTWCPFGITHPDGGIEAAFRLYEDTGGCYCFACARAWTPVSLMAEYWDCGRAEAAGKMCEMAGVTEQTWRDRWEALQQPQVPDHAALSEALKTWCRRVTGPVWEQAQYQDWVSEPLGHCLRLLPLVRTAQEANEWLDGCKAVMRPILERRG
jgi:hypothetical protein